VGNGLWFSLLLPHCTDIRDALEDELDMEHVRQHSNRQAVYAWPLFPIHPKQASLFMNGFPLIKGFKLGADLCETFPVEYVEKRQLFEHQFCMGITKRQNHNPTLVAGLDCQHENPFNGNALTNGYFGMWSHVQNLFEPGLGLVAMTHARGSLQPSGGIMQTNAVLGTVAIASIVPVNLSASCVVQHCCLRGSSLLCQPVEVALPFQLVAFVATAFDKLDCHLQH
jgi:hypothetical protein